MASPKRKTRTWRFYVGYSFFLILVLAFALELGLRVFGPGPWKPSTQTFHVAPGGRMFIPDSLLGFRGKPGAYDCNINDRLSFHLTHDTAGFRITGPPGTPDTLEHPEIWIFGCSFTHGYGVDDSLTWPWKVQEMLPGYRVRNFAMTAYSTYQCLLLLDTLLNQPHREIAAVVLAYGSFHAQRNTASRFWRKALHGRQAANGILYPYVTARGAHAQVLQRGVTDLAYRPWPGQSRSALVHFLEIQSNHIEEQALRTEEVTRSLIEKMDELSRTRFILAAIQRDLATLRMLEKCSFADTMDISQDLEDPAMRILPDDGHPSAGAHDVMARTFVERFGGLNSRGNPHQQE